MSEVVDPQACQMSIVSAQERLADFVTDLTARVNNQLWLYQTNVAPNPQNTLGMFTEATFNGYARYSPIVFLTQGVDTVFNAKVTSQLKAFACTGGSPSNQIFGSLHVATPSGGLLGSATNAGSTGGAYSSAFVIVAAGAKYGFPPQITLNGATGTGATATAVLNANGTLAAIDLVTPGSGYTTYTVLIDPPLELIKQNVLSTSGISMALSTDVLSTYTELVEPANAS